MSRVFVIAEAGVNHDGVLDDALRLIDVAAGAGADAVKFQTFDAARLVTARAARADYQAANLGEAGDQLSMLRRLQLSHEDHHRLARHAADRGVRFMSTAFDVESLAFLAEFDMPAIKIPSGDITYAAMLLQAARLGLPIIMSTGMATEADIAEALAVIAWGLTREGLPTGPEDLVLAYADPDARARLRAVVTLLHCTTEYPAPLESVNLRAMTGMGETFGLPVGYSDHTLGVTVPIAAVARGATVIEKHFTLDRTRIGPDHAASLEPEELAAMVRGVRDVEAALGSSHKQVTAAEAGNRPIARRALVAARPIAAGEPFSLDNLTAKRPAAGRSPMTVWSLIGCPAGRAYAEDEAIDP